MISGKKILLTGGSGFIGSHMGEKLVEDNQLVIFDTGNRDSLSFTQLASHPNVEVVAGGDVLNAQQLKEATAGCQCVIHMAGIAGIDTVVKKPVHTMEVNLQGSVNVLRAVVDSPDIEHVILFSTSEVYGPYVYRGTESELTTQGPIGESRWAYAVSKLAAEHYGFCYYDAHKTPVTSVRPFNVYGPRQLGESALRKFCIQAIADEDITITGDGNQIRAWCFVSDFVDGVVGLLGNQQALGQVFNIGNAKQTITILGLAEMIIRLAGSKSQILFKEQLRADVQVRVPSIQKSVDLFGFAPNVGLEEGIQQTLAWLRDNSAN